MSYYSAKEKREKKKRRDNLLRELTQEEHDYFQKKRLKIFKKAYRQETGCGCCAGILFGGLLSFIGLSASEATWQQKLLTFLILWSIFTVFFPLFNVWEAKIEKEIDFLETIMKTRLETRKELVDKIYFSLKRVAQKKHITKVKEEVESVFITKR
ncbi:hypothetical protein [Streptococcus sp. SS-4456]|uniref:hypothetical protein n=1 Tax=Streptococcus sp. SS-4456 TaxID=3072286 RepID=UPI002FC8B1E2